jgi:putative FmdB family regulatory protein
MPLYEYSCQACGEKEEKLEGFDAPTEHDCAGCGQALGMRRQVSLTSFTLAGGGWMAQGYGKGTPGKTAGPAAAAPAAKAEAAAPAAAAGCAGGCACHTAKN